MTIKIEVSDDVILKILGDDSSIKDINEMREFIIAELQTEQVFIEVVADLIDFD